MWAWWVAAGVGAWLAVGLAVSLVMGAMVRLADRREGLVGTAPAAAEPASAARVARAGGVARPARRRLPLPPVGVALVGAATALMVTGYVVRVAGARGPSAQLFSMDAPFSIPRLFVAAVFAAAAVAALTAASRVPGRRTWWAGVGIVAAAIAAVKAGSSVHATATSVLDTALSPATTLAVSLAVGVLVIGALGWLSRGDRRDRRRVLGALVLYGTAAVVLSALSVAVTGAYGSSSVWAAGATFIEETGEALAGVAFLLAVFVGVAPRLVLPTDWLLQRAADAHSLELPSGSSPVRIPDQRTV